MVTRERVSKEKRLVGEQNWLIMHSPGTQANWNGFVEIKMFFVFAAHQSW